MIDPTCRNINRLFAQSLNINANDNDDFPQRNSFNNYYLPLVEIKDFNLLINHKK